MLLRPAQRRYSAPAGYCETQPRFQFCREKLHATELSGTQIEGLDCSQGCVIGESRGVQDFLHAYLGNLPVRETVVEVRHA